MIPYTTIPFVSAFFLVLVGTLIGHVFWSQFRSRYRQLIAKLQNRSRLLDRELKSRTAELNGLREQTSFATEQLRIQSEELESLRVTSRTLRCEHQEMTSRLAQEVQSRSDLEKCLQDEQQQRRRDVQELRTALFDARRTVETGNEDNETWQAQLAALQESLADARSENERLNRRLAESAEFADACQKEQKQIQEERETELQQAHISRDRIAQLETELAALRRELNSVDDHKDSLNYQLEAIHGALRQREASIRLLQADVDKMNTQRDEFQLAFQQMQEQQQLLAEKNEELSTERDELRHALAAQREASGSASRTAAEGLESERALRQQAESRYERTKTQLSEMRQEVERLALVEDKLIETDAALRDAKDELKRLRREHEAVVQAETATREIVGELRDELAANSEDVERLRRERDTSASQFECERRQRQQLEQVLSQAETRLASLQNENDAWSQHHAKLVAQTAEMSEQMQHWQTRSHELQQRNERAQRQIDELAAQLESQQHLAEKRRRRRFVSLDDGEFPPVRTGFSFRDLRRRELADPVDSESTVEPPRKEPDQIQHSQQQDDLKKIPGIADRLEKQLHRIGIYTYRQIMAWNDHAIADVSQRLDLGDLIRRDDWIGHARRLVEQDDRRAA